MAAMPSVQQPDAAAERDEHAEQHIAEPVRDIHGSAEGVAEEISDRDKTGGPYHCRQKIQAQEPLPANRAEPEREGREIPDAVNKAEREDKPDIVPLQPGERVLDAGAPARKTVQQTHAIIPAQPEIALIAEIAAEPGADQQQQRVEQTLRRREPGEQHDRLALEECPDKNKEIKIHAVIGNELEIHCRLLTRFQRWGLAKGGRTIPASRDPAMLNRPAIPVERIPSGAPAARSLYMLRELLRYR